LFEESAENVRAICDRMEIAMVDCVISGLPWALFSKSMQITLLEQMMRVLKPGGRFVTFRYVQSLALTAARRLTALLPTYFTTVSKSRVIWRNVPPAFVYCCRR
jgi:phospholipid N-methyltransferase